MAKHPVPNATSRQQGAVLVVVLILLLVMTILGLVGTRVSLLQERMGATMFDRSLAFQAAEAALREGEEFVVTAPAPATGCAAGLCGFPDPAATPVWEVPAVWSAAPSVTLGTGATQVEADYIIERLADEVPVDPASCTSFIDVTAVECGGEGKRYRITARVQQADRSTVMLQSIFAVP